MPTKDVLSETDPLVVRPREACRLLSCSPPSLYRLIRTGEIASFLDGRSRKIVTASLHDFVARRAAAPRKAGLTSDLVTKQPATAG
jgi:excisionase family DNA binding protein